jgi:hypothetical protein
MFDFEFVLTAFLKLCDAKVSRKGAKALSHSIAFLFATPRQAQGESFSQRRKGRKAIQELFILLNFLVKAKRFLWLNSNYISLFYSLSLGEGRGEA